MKKIFLIGKINTGLKKIYNILSKDYNVQICSDNNSFINEMFSVTIPDMVIINTTDFTFGHREIFITINRHALSAQVLCICGNQSSDLFSNIIDSHRITYLSMTIFDKAVIKNKVDELMYTKPELESELAASLASDLGLSINKDAVADTDTRKTILLVDDDSVQLRALKSLLQDKYKVLMSTSGTEAIVLLGKKHPDAILLDYNMPVCDGRQTLKMIREIDEAKDIPVIFLTGISDKAHIEMVLKLGPAGYLLKPLKPDALFELLNKIF